MDQTLVLDLHPFLVLSLGEPAFAVLVIELVDPGEVGMDRDEGVDDVKSDVDSLPVPEVLLTSRVLVQ